MEKFTLPKVKDVSHKFIKYHLTKDLEEVEDLLYSLDINYINFIRNITESKKSQANKEAYIEAVHDEFISLRMDYKDQIVNTLTKVLGYKPNY